jgi:hypothetical protein
MLLACKLLEEEKEGSSDSVHTRDFELHIDHFQAVQAETCLKGQSQKFTLRGPLTCSCSFFFSSLAVKLKSVVRCSAS